MPRLLGVAALVLMIGGRAPALAAWSATLPTFAACTPATPPAFPQRWRAVGLMLPFLQGPLDVGEFVYDATVPALRATVYGVESKAVDLLITDAQTYLLRGPHDAPRSCIALGRKLRPPSPQWVSGDSRCVGESPLGNRMAQWWQVAGFDPARYWISKDTRLPLRTSFVRRSLDPAIIGDYAMTFFPTFTPLAKTDLAALRDQCAKSTEHREIAASTPTARELMALADRDAEAERETRIGILIPNLSFKACAGATPARWPDRFVMTGMVTPIRITDTPSSAVMLYDWPKAHTFVFLPFQGNPPAMQGIVMLKQGVGYRLRFRSVGGEGICAPVFPGVVRPDWMASASCRCRAVIAGHSPFGFDTDSQIMSCPIKFQGQRVMWTWYAKDSRPIMFMEAQPEGQGVMLVDYHDWLPAQELPAGNFSLPKACPVGAASGTAAPGGASFSNPSCSDCHSTPW